MPCSPPSTRRRLLSLLLLTLTTLSGTPAFSAALPVTLFGQPCQLEGELSREQLEQIHAISPEQIPPAEDEKAAQGAVNRLKKAGPLPSSLESYREKALRHFEAWASFHRGLELSRKAGSPDAFIVATRSFLLPHSSQAFLNRSEFQAKSAAWTETTRERLQQAYESAIAGRPDEDFHGALQLLGVRYECAFDRAGRTTPPGSP